MSAQPATQTAQPPAQGPMTVEQRVVATHDFLSKLLKGDGKSSPEKLCQERWDNWSSVVRVDFLNRSKKAVIALVQRDLPKKQWAQWEITVKFCIDDIINKAIQTKDKKWADNAAVGSLIKTIADRKENEIDPEGFKAKIDKMIADIKVPFASR